MLAVQADVTDPDAMVGFAEAAFGRFGRVDLWINNAGIVDPVGPLRDASAADLRRNVDVNVLGVLHGSQAYLRQLHARNQRGVLLNVSSGAGRNPYRGWGVYCASKAAVDRLSEVLALEEEGRVRVLSVAPGVVDTQMQSTLRGQSQDTFPDVERFQQLHAEGQLRTPRDAAQRLLEVAFDPEQTEVCLRV